MDAAVGSGPTALRDQRALNRNSKDNKKGTSILHRGPSSAGLVAGAGRLRRRRETTSWAPL